MHKMLSYHFLLFYLDLNRRICVLENIRTSRSKSTPIRERQGESRSKSTLTSPMRADFQVHHYSLLLGVIFNILLLLGVVFDSNILAKNFLFIFKNIYELNINKSAFSGASPLLGVVFHVFLLLGVVFVPKLFGKNFLCDFKTYM